MSNDYPRDMIGYGATPPEANWPGGARLALSFVINCTVTRPQRRSFPKSLAPKPMKPGT